VSEPNWVTELPLVWLSLSQFENMHEYSTTLPTGTTIGKKWRRYLFDGPAKGTWILCEYVEDPDPKYVGIKNSRIAVDGRENITSAPHEFGTLAWRLWFETLDKRRGDQAIEILPDHIKEKIASGGWAPGEKVEL
jgi:hypothetical protein